MAPSWHPPRKSLLLCASGCAVIHVSQIISITCAKRRWPSACDTMTISYSTCHSTSSYNELQPRYCRTATWWSIAAPLTYKSLQWSIAAWSHQASIEQHPSILKGIALYLERLRNESRPIGKPTKGEGLAGFLCYTDSRNDGCFGFLRQAK